MNLYEPALVVKKGFQIPRWIWDVQNGVNLVKNVLAPNEIQNFFNSDNNKSYIIFLGGVCYYHLVAGDYRDVKGLISAKPAEDNTILLHSP